MSLLLHRRFILMLSTLLMLSSLCPCSGSPAFGKSFQLGEEALEKGDLKNAELYFQKALDEEPPDSGQQVFVLQRLALLYNASGDKVKLESTLKRNLALQEKLKWNQDTTVRNLAGLYFSMGKVAEGRSLFSSQLNKLEASHGKTSPELIPLLIKMGDAYSGSGDLKLAEEYFQRAIQIHMADATHPEPVMTAHARLELADILLKQGKYKSAERLVSENLELLKTQSSTTKTILASNYRELGLAFYLQGKLEQAQRNFQQALDLLLQHFGITETNTGLPPMVFDELCSLVNTYLEQGKVKQAESLLMPTLERMKKLGPDERLRVAHGNELLALIYLSQGRSADALSLMDDSLSVFEPSSGRKTPALAYCLTIKARILEKMGRFTEAESELKKALAIDEDVLGRRHPRVGKILDQYAGLAKGQGKLQLSRELAERARSIKEAQE